MLLADDHAFIREGLRAILEPYPEFFIAGEAVDGRDAIEKSSRLKPDVVILDLSMPGMDGLDTVREIAKGVPETQILILSMHDSEIIARQALQAGARGYLLKSDAGRDLLNALKTLQANQTYYSPQVAEKIMKPPDQHGEI